MSISQRSCVRAVIVIAALATASGTPIPRHSAGAPYVGPISTDQEWIVDSSDDDFVEPDVEDLQLAANVAAIDVAELEPGPAAASQSGIRAPQIGSSDNPFANTCNGRSIGFVGPAGDAPRLEFTGAPAGATFQCRTGPAGSVARQPFTNCDGADGSKPSHVPPLSAEGTYRTEVRYTVGNQMSAVAAINYYAHHSLDRVACCRTPASDADLFTAARSVIPSTDTFANVRVENPFITIDRPRLAKSIGHGNTTKILSLRRAFVVSPDKRFVLIRRTMASRRAQERTRQTSCVGLRISSPIRSTAAAKKLSCSSSFPWREAYDDGAVRARCPGIYCTVSTCEIDQNGCKRVTHTFNRGPNQQPWVVRKMVCPDPVLTAFTSYECDAYVVNAKGQAACLGIVNGRPQVKKAFTDGDGLGLKILGPQRPLRQAKLTPGQQKPPDQYVFSAKSRKAGVKNALFLPN
jgi:hypothetical protein